MARSACAGAAGDWTLPVALVSQGRKYDSGSISAGREGKKLSKLEGREGSTSGESRPCSCVYGCVLVSSATEAEESLGKAVHDCQLEVTHTKLYWPKIDGERLLLGVS